MIHVPGAGFCDDQLPVLSTIGRGPVGPQGEKGDKGDPGTPTFADPLEWDGDREYEQNTIVLHEGNSYVSIAPVPAGIDISDDTYWALAANYNAQIEACRQEVSAMDQEIKTRTISFRTLSDMQDADDLYVGAFCKTYGYYNFNDGGGGNFVISDVDSNDVLSFQVGDGLYALNIDTDICLPRYGGENVNEMVDNARPYIIAHRWQTITLPEPNANHPACGSWTEQSTPGTKYFWYVDAPIVMGEEFAYSYVDFKGNICNRPDATNLEAIVKVSDSRKPEDIYVERLVIGGYHYGGVVKVTNGLLVEGSARLNIQHLQAGYCDNCIMLGGANQNNPIEVNIDFAEIGSWYDKAIKADIITGSCIFRANTLVIQNPLADHVTFIYGTGTLYDWHIGDMQVSLAGQSYIVDNVFYFDYPEGSSPNYLNSQENVLRVDSCRCTGNNFGTFGNSGTFSFGLVTFAGPASGVPKITAKGWCQVIFDTFGCRTASLETVVETAYAMIKFGNCTPFPTISSSTMRNIIINGICYNVMTAGRIPTGLVYEKSANDLRLVAEGENKGVLQIV